MQDDDVTKCRAYVLCVTVDDRSLIFVVRSTACYLHAIIAESKNAELSTGCPRVCCLPDYSYNGALQGTKREMGDEVVADGVPPEPPPRDYFSSFAGDDRLRLRLEACRDGLLQLDVMRTKHTHMMEQLRCRLPVIPGNEDVMAREKKFRDILDRSSIQSVDSGVSSFGQTTLASTRSSSPALSSNEDLSSDYATIIKQPLHTYEMPPTMPYSTFRKISLENEYKPIVTSRSCHRGVWQVPQRPKSMYDSANSPNDFLSNQSPYVDSHIFQKHRHAFAPSGAPNRPDHATRSFARPFEELQNAKIAPNPSPNQRRLRTAQKPEVVRKSKVEKADVMFRANCVYLEATTPQSQRRTRLRFSPSRSPPTRKAFFATNCRSSQSESPLYASPCKIRSRMEPSQEVVSAPLPPQSHKFAAKPFFPSRTTANRLAAPTWTQSQPL
ncbi:unnamed protein product [Caenorhabditis auriculariae]|uniref:Uncharacterized protein n=1 Tax=Caenorhabditis auriculariae TaxID=2777116 RepID=A0A8S1GNF5_9PELO|nr:unnamed protein product [Caenorhabditis auriculariae]